VGIVESRNEVEAYLKAFAFVSVRAAEDVESFEPGQDVFHDQTLLCQRAVFSFLLGCKGMMLARLVGCA